jgi:hypothetical protein
MAQTRVGKANQLVTRKLDERMMKKEFKVEYLQHKAKTLKMMKI